MKPISGFSVLTLAALFAATAAPLMGQASLAPPPAPLSGEEERLTDEEKGNRAVIGVVGGVTGYYAVRGVGSAARSVVSKAPVVRDVPHYGSNIGKVPVIGGKVLQTNIPTTLGQVPIVGKPISNIPVVGRVIAGPPNPILVGAVAVDTYVLPKYAPCGWTESAIFTNTDFNSAPYLRQYVNYLAPLPYTHPPIYAPGPLSPGAAEFIPMESVIPASAAIQQHGGSVRIEF